MKSSLRVLALGPLSTSSLSGSSCRKDTPPRQCQCQPMVEWAQTGLQAAEGQSLGGRGISIGLLQSQAEREGTQGQTDTGHGPFTQEACDSHLPCPPHLPSPHLLNSDSKTKTKTKPDLFLTSLKTN